MYYRRVYKLPFYIHLYIYYKNPNLIHFIAGEVKFEILLKTPNQQYGPTDPIA